MRGMRVDLVGRAFHLSVLLLLLAFGTGCSNVIRSGLMNSNTVFLDPSMNRTVYLQLRNTSENQQVGLHGIEQKLAAKHYLLTSDPVHANYWIQAKVVYCHQAAEEVTPESVAKPGFGAGIGSGGTAMPSAHDASMGVPGMPDINALMRQMSSMRGINVPGMQPPPKEEGVTYLCVADVQITDRKMGKPMGQPVASQTHTGVKVQQMRMVGHVRQKELDIPEATPIIEEKICTGIAGLF